MEISKILKLERKKRRYTQQQIADIINISRGAYAKYETGENTPTLDNLMKIADLYGLSLDYLAGRYQKPGEIANKTDDRKKTAPQD